MITIQSPSQPALSPAGLTRFLNRARNAAGLSGEVDVLLADDSTLRRLNKSFRGKNKPTDVLSFPAPQEIFAVHAGDLAISLETAARQAEAYGHSLRDEVRILLLHGLLHLSGLDHETDKGEMAAREAALRRDLRLPNTLIERASIPPSARPPSSARASRKASKLKPATAKPRRSASSSVSLGRKRGPR
jgi:probable rRNA maturation factor